MDTIKKLKNIYYGLVRAKWKFKYQKHPSDYVPVLAYHWFCESEEERAKLGLSSCDWMMSLERFEHQIKWLVDHNYNFISIGDLYKWLTQDEELPEKPILLTFDDGVVSQAGIAVQMLKKYGARGCCFAVGKYWDDATVEMPEGAVEDDVPHFTRNEYYSDNDAVNIMEIQAHTYNKHHRLNGTEAVVISSDEDLSEDCEKMRDLGFEHIALPYGAYGKNTVDVLKRYYKSAFAISAKGCVYANKKSDLYRINRIMISGNSDVEALEKYLY